MASELNISRERMQHILKSELAMQNLTEAQKSQTLKKQRVTSNLVFFVIKRILNSDFCEQKILTENTDNILEGVQRSMALKHFGHRLWTFQQISEPSQHANRTKHYKHLLVYLKTCGLDSFFTKWAASAKRLPSAVIQS